MSFRLNAPLATACAIGMSLLLVACGGSAPKATATQENEEKLVKFAKCMREHGVSVTTSTASGGGIVTGCAGSSPPGFGARASTAGNSATSPGNTTTATPVFFPFGE